MTDIKSIKREVADELNYKANSEDGVHFLSGTSAAPEDSYYGFVVTGSGTAIDSITYIENYKQTGDITAITLVQGGYYPIPGRFSTITLSAGDMILLKKRN